MWICSVNIIVWAWKLTSWSWISFYFSCAFYLHRPQFTWRCRVFTSLHNFPCFLATERRKTTPYHCQEHIIAGVGRGGGFLSFHLDTVRRFVDTIFTLHGRWTLREDLAKVETMLISTNVVCTSSRLIQVVDNPAIAITPSRTWRKNVSNNLWRNWCDVKMACVSRVSCARESSRLGRVGKSGKTKVGLTAPINFWEFFKHFSRNQWVTLDTELAYQIADILPLRHCPNARVVTRGPETETMTWDTSPQTTTSICQPHDTNIASLKPRPCRRNFSKNYNNAGLILYWWYSGNSATFQIFQPIQVKRKRMVFTRSTVWLKVWIDIAKGVISVKICQK